MNDIVSSLHDEPQPMSLRERKKRLAQATIEETALRLFQQQGYEQTSIQDIADAVMMSPRTFFRYFASKEEVLLGPTRTVLSDGLRFLRDVAPTASSYAALRAIFVYVAGLYQQQRASFLIRYQVAMQTPQFASMYLYAMLTMESTICDELCSHLETATSHHEIRFLVAIHMTALRVALEEWFETEARADLASLLRERLDAFSSLAQNA